jgi:hypothetical protein
MAFQLTEKMAYLGRIFSGEQIDSILTYINTKDHREF